MNRLPDYRRVLAGRTFDRPYSHSDYDPITVYRSSNWASRLLAVAIGVSFAIVIVRWIDWSLS